MADNLPLLVNLDGVLLQTPTYSVESQPALDQAETGFRDVFERSLPLPSRLPPPGSGAGG